MKLIYFGDTVFFVKKIVELNLAATTDELELLISSMLSSDITLFEKISSSAYRLRISSVTKECEIDQSDSEDFGSVDDDSKDGSRYSSSDDSEFDSAVSCSIKSNQRSHHNSNTNMLVIDTEIDESHPGKVWLLGLTEGEYSELSIEEKLNALVALIDLLSAGSSIRMEVIYPIFVSYILLKLFIYCIFILACLIIICL